MKQKFSETSIPIGDELARAAASERRKKSSRDFSFYFFTFLIISCTILVLAFGRNFKKDEKSSTAPQNFVVNYFIQKFVETPVDVHSCDKYQIQAEKILEDFFEDFPTLENFNEIEDFKSAVTTKVQRAADEVAMSLKISPMTVAEFLAEGIDDEIEFEFPLSCFAENFYEIRSMANEALNQARVEEEKKIWKLEEQKVGDDKIEDFYGDVDELSNDSNQSAEILEDNLEDLMEVIAETFGNKLDDIQDDGNDIKLVVLDGIFDVNLKDETLNNEEEKIGKDESSQDNPETLIGQLGEILMNDTKAEQVKDNSTVNELIEILQNEVDDSQKDPEDEAETLIDELKEILEDAAEDQHDEVKRDAKFDLLTELEGDLDLDEELEELQELKETAEVDQEIVKRDANFLGGNLGLDDEELESLLDNEEIKSLLEEFEGLEDQEIVKRDANFLEAFTELKGRIDIEDEELDVEEDLKKTADIVKRDTEEILLAELQSAVEEAVEEAGGDIEKAIPAIENILKDNVELNHNIAKRNVEKTIREVEDELNNSLKYLVKPFDDGEFTQQKINHFYSEMSKIVKNSIFEGAFNGANVKLEDFPRVLEEIKERHIHRGKREANANIFGNFQGIIEETAGDEDLTDDLLEERQNVLEDELLEV